MFDDDAHVRCHVNDKGKKSLINFSQLFYLKNTNGFGVNLTPSSGINNKHEICHKLKKESQSKN